MKTHDDLKKAKADVAEVVVRTASKKFSTQTEAAKHLGLPSQRFNRLKQGHLDKFALSTLFNYARLLGHDVTFQIGTTIHERREGRVVVKRKYKA